ncbi:MAG: histidinol-phosphate aminotransferase [Planctomycetota bacterium]
MRSPSPYAPPAVSGSIDLQLSRNEGRAPRTEPLEQVTIPLTRLSRYPELTELKKQLALRFGLPTDRVLLTAGGDDALLRTCLATLSEGQEALVATPTFEMIPRYAALTGGSVREVAWPEGAFPIDAMIAAVNERTAVAYVVSPNNPTGAVATRLDVQRIAEALPHGLVVLDAAYGEFADDDPTEATLELENVVVVRTLSKAWGLAGLRVGCILATRSWVQRLEASGNPFPVSVSSAAIALQRLVTGENDVQDYIAQVAVERDELATLLRNLGASPAQPACANFVLARGVDPGWVTAALATQGIAIRAFPDHRELADAVRITVPGDPIAFARLQRALASAIRPQALLFDMDGVLADVSDSYRTAIRKTVAGFGAETNATEIDAAKARGNSNDDWLLTQALLAQHGLVIPLEEVTARFEELYQGTPQQEALLLRETLLVSREQLASWRTRYKLAIVTGRPRKDALRFLERFNLLGEFDAVVCREDALLKPEPAPVRLALERLGVCSAWMLGDTPDDIGAARSAGVIPIGVIAPGADPMRARSNLERAGAARVLDRVTELEGLFS